jgi:poly(3-hydroxybutyrate) depolymerase
VQAGAGHYGVFNGRRFRTEIVPRIVEFIHASQAAIPAKAAKKPAAIDA